MIRLAIQSIHEANQQICGHEVLARKLQNGKPVAPGVFMATGKAREWFDLDMAIYQLVAENPLLRKDPWPLFINMSPATLEHMNLFAQALPCIETIASSRHAQTVIEISEESSLDSYQLEVRLESLRHTGVMVAMDDFGVAYSNIDRLRAHDWGYCKIDLQSLSDAENLDWLIAAKVLCDERNIKIVLERFESHKSRDLLQPFNNCLYQGYAFSRPRMLNELLRFERPRTQVLG